jgi:hypothetical protein
MTKKRNATKLKGDIGLTKVIADLTEKGYEISIPLAEHMPYDLIFHDVDGTGKLYRLQVKYSARNTVKCATSYLTKNGTITSKYETEDFEYYAIYLPDIKECVYLPNKNKNNVKVRTVANSKCYNNFIWWEDYKLPNQTELVYRTAKDMDPKFTIKGTHSKEPRPKSRKVKNRPSKEELQAMINTTPMLQIGKNFGVSDNAVRKWAKYYEIELGKRKPKLSQPETVIKD